MASFAVGIIGMGDMGKMYARKISEAGWNSPPVPFLCNDDLSAFGSSMVCCDLRIHFGCGVSGWAVTDNQAFESSPLNFVHRINACDRPDKYEVLRKEFEGRKNIQVFSNGHLVSRSSDYIIYSVEAENIDRVVAEFGPSTKMGAIVGGQTSCKAPEIAAFEKHLPSDCEIVSCHSLHGPGVNPKGQPLVLIKHKSSQESFNKVEKILSCLESKHVHLTWQQHDRITADTQAVTHAAFLSMGAAWAANKQYPWQIPRYLGGIENVKINVMMRIYFNKWHVYAGLAIMNPSARDQIREYATSVTELFKLMLRGQREEFTERIQNAGRKVFGAQPSSSELLLDDKVLDRFSLGELPPERVKNSHLSLLAMVDCWSRLEIVPYNHMICSTPLFRMWLGITEYLFRTPSLLEETINTAIDDVNFRGDDLEFTFAARDWSERVDLCAFDAYREKFEKIQQYFAPRFPEAQKIGNEMIRTILEKTMEG